MYVYIYTHLLSLPHTRMTSFCRMHTHTFDAHMCMCDMTLYTSDMTYLAHESCANTRVITHPYVT